MAKSLSTAKQIELIDKQEIAKAVWIIIPKRLLYI